MEGPLVSDTTELLNGASGASEDAPVGTPAPSPAAGAPSAGDVGSPEAVVPASKSRSRSGAGLSSLLMPELQRIAQTMGIPGAGRMRKGQLVEAIEARQGGGPRQETGAAKQGSDKRAGSAKADSARSRKQGAMESDTQPRPGSEQAKVLAWETPRAAGSARTPGSNSASTPSPWPSEPTAGPGQRRRGVPRLSRPQLSRPQLSRPRLSRPQLSRPQLSRPPAAASAEPSKPPVQATETGISTAAAPQVATQPGEPASVRRSAVTVAAGTAAATSSPRAEPRAVGARDQSARDQGSRDSGRDQGSPRQRRSRTELPRPERPRQRRPRPERPGPAAATRAAVTRAAVTRARP